MVSPAKAIRRALSTAMPGLLVLFQFAGVLGFVLRPVSASAEAPVTITSPTQGSTISTGTTTITGTGPANKRVFLLINGQNIGQTVPIDSSGNWSYTPAGIVNGSTTVQADLVDGTGLAASESGVNAGAEVQFGTGSLTPVPASMTRPNQAALDETDNRLFIDDQSTYVQVYDSQTNAFIGTIHSEPDQAYDPTFGLVYDSTRGLLYIVNILETLVVNPQTLAVEKSVPDPNVGCYGGGTVMASPTTSMLYIAQGCGPALSFDRSTDTYGTIPGAPTMLQSALSNDGSTLYYNTGGNYLTVHALITSSNTVSSVTYTSPSQAFQYFIPSPDGTKLYGGGNATMYTFNAATGALLNTASGAGFGPYNISPDGTKLYTETNIFNTTTHTFSGSLAGGPEFLDPTDTYLYGTYRSSVDYGNQVNIYSNTGTLVKQIGGLNVGPGPILFAHSSNLAYALSPASGTYAVINTLSQTLVANVGTGARNNTQYFTLPDGSKSYAIADNGSTIQQVDPTTGSLIGTIQLPGVIEFSGLGSAAYLAPSGNLYAITRRTTGPSTSQDELVKINTATATITSALPLSTSDEFWTLAINETGNVAYASDISSTQGISSINMTTGTTTPHLTTTINGIERLLISPDGSTLYASNITAGTPNLYQISTSSMTISNTVSLGSTGQIIDIELSPDGTSLYYLYQKTSPSTTYGIQKLSASNLSVQLTQSLPYGYLEITVAPSGVIFLVGSTLLSTLDASTLTVLGSDYLPYQSMTLNPASFFYSTASVTFTENAPPISITTTSLPDAVSGVEYYQGLTDQNATGNIVWSMTSGSLPAGFEMTSDGHIGGSTAATGLYSFTVMAKDARSQATQSLSLTVDSGSSFTLAGLASYELGQTDGSGNLVWTQANSGPTAANNLDVPTATVVDPVNHRLYVEDMGTNRVLEYDLNSINQVISQGANVIIGQSGPTGNGPATTQTGLSLQQNNGGLAYDPTRGYLFVSDSSNNRVTVYDTNNLATGMPASFVIGQSGWLTAGHALSQTGLWMPQGLTYDPLTKLLYVSDSFNDRVMVFNTSTLTDGMTASFELGEPDFQTDLAGDDAATLDYPDAVSVDSSGSRLFVADNFNNRVVEFNTANLTSGETASLVLGQPDLTTDNWGTISSSSLEDPQGVSYDAANQRLFVSEYQNNRVLVFDVSNPSDNESASSVIGQPDFTSNSSGTTQGNLYWPAELSYDPNSHQLFVPDSNNVRIMIWDLLALTPGTVGSGQVGSAYSGQMSATNVEGILSYALYSGSLPPGLSMSNSGAISGTPTTAGTYTFSVRASDNIFPMGTVFDTVSYSITISSPPSPPSAPSHASVVTPPSSTTTSSTPAASPSPSASPETQTVLNTDPGFTSDSGTTQTLAPDQSVTFYVGTTDTPATTDVSTLSQASGVEQHSATVTDVGSNYADLLVQSTPIKVHIAIGQTVDVDVNHNGHPAISIYLASITNGHANLVFKSLLSATAPLAQPEQNAATSKSPQTSQPSLLPYLLAGLAVILVLGAGVFLAIRARRQPGPPLMI